MYDISLFVSPRVPTSLPYYDSRSSPPPPFSPICLLAYKDTCPKYSPIKLFIHAGMVHPLPLPSALKPWGEQGGARDIVRAKAGSYSCHREDTICIDSSVGIIFCGRRQQPIEYFPPVAGGGGLHNESPWRGSGLLGGWRGVFFADWSRLVPNHLYLINLIRYNTWASSLWLFVVTLFLLSMISIGTYLCPVAHIPYSWTNGSAWQWMAFLFMSECAHSNELDPFAYNKNITATLREFQLWWFDNVCFKNFYG